MYKFVKYILLYLFKLKMRTCAYILENIKLFFYYDVIMFKHLTFDVTKTFVDYEICFDIMVSTELSANLNITSIWA